MIGLALILVMIAAMEIYDFVSEKAAEKKKRRSVKPCLIPSMQRIKH